MGQRVLNDVLMGANIAVVSGAMILIISVGLGVTSRSETTLPERLELRPIPSPPPNAFGLLGFEIRAPWMQGVLRMRMPETLSSTLGLHFIDHDRPDMRPLSMLNSWPSWTTDPRTGALRYETRTVEGIRFGGKVTPHRDHVVMEFRVRNVTRDRTIDVSNQMCLVMADATDFSARNTLEGIWTFVEGKPFSLTQATPTAASKGRAPWVLMLTKSGSTQYTGPRDYPDGWWVVEQIADLPVLARTSQDGRHLVAITWDGDPLYLMSNTRIPCLHAGPTNAPRVAPGKEYVWRGIIWLMENDAERLRREVEGFVKRSRSR